MQAGASALSVLTDGPGFGGSCSDITVARQFNYCPILRKDFITDEYQVIEARAAGADAILLIAAAMPAARLRQLAAFASSLQLEVLLELHERKELDAVNEYTKIIGINNRSLATFQTDVQRSFEMAQHLPADCVAVSESGIEDANTILQLRTAGFSGFLVGTSFMRHSSPEKACAALIRSLKNNKKSAGI